MKEMHLKRTSNLLFLIHVITTFFLFVGLMSQIKMSELPKWRGIVPLVIGLLIFVVCLLVKLIKKDAFFYIRFTAIAFSAYYVVLMLLSGNGNTFPYMIPFMVVFMMTMDGLATKTSSIVFIIMNIIRVVMNVSAAEEVAAVLESNMLEMIITVLTFIAVIRGVSLIRQFFEASVTEVADAAKKDREVGEKIIEVAGTVEEHASMMADQIQVIKESTNSVYTSMDNVNAGITGTVEAITEQTYQTKEIMDILDETNEKTQNIVEINKEANQSLKEGSQAMEKMIGLMGKVNESSMQMQEASNELQNKSEQVRSITDIILGISNQTNLLALNASIEAARAGEAGKGFAVVAEEIRNLAEQTRQETENITALIDGLSQDATSLDAKVKDNVAMAEEENTYAKTANEKFVDITEKIDTLSENVKTVSQMMQSLLTSNNAIVDSVNTLSATSEEISASSQETCDVSEKNVALISEFEIGLQDILEEIHSLQQISKQGM